MRFDFSLNNNFTVDPSPYFGMVRRRILYHHFNYVGLLQYLLFCYVWWPCMAINANVQYNSSGLLPDIHC